MAKAKRAKKAAAVPLPGMTPEVVNPFGPTQQRGISKSKVVASEFTLDDGTILLVTPMVADVRRAVDQFNQNGDPLYFLTMGSTVTTVAPKRLKRQQTPKPAKKTKAAKKK
jgi:hypothetical protein